MLNQKQERKWALELSVKGILPGAVDARLVNFRSHQASARTNFTRFICASPDYLPLGLRGWDNTDSLRASLHLINTFSELSGLKMNKKKTKALWIGSSKGNKSKILSFECVKVPIKTLGTFLSHDESKNK